MTASAALASPGVLTLGESMAVLTAPDVGPLRHAASLRLGIAGAESNVAIGLARLGVAATWLGRVGDDEFGRLITRTLRAEQVSVAAIIDDEARTGLMVKERRTEQATRVLYYRAGSAGSRLCPEDLSAVDFHGARVLHLTGITPALGAAGEATVRAAVATAREHGLRISLDINHRATLWSDARASAVLCDLVSSVDLLFAGEDEAHLLVDADDPVDRLRAMAALGPDSVLLKRGPRGALALIEGEVREVAPYPVRAVDPVGAGDAFAAGYLAGLCLDQPVEQRLDTAAAAGAFAVTVSGDWEGAPSRDELALLRPPNGGVLR